MQRSYEEYTSEALKGAGGLILQLLFMIVVGCQISFLHVKYHFWLIIKFAYHLRPLIFVTLREHSCHQLLRYQLIGIATV